MEVIRAYRMKGQGEELVDMGYVIIDKQGDIHTRQIDRQFGEHVETMLRALRQAQRQT